jgi:hypothetical protein
LVSPLQYINNFKYILPLLIARPSG